MYVNIDEQIRDEQANKKASPIVPLHYELIDVIWMSKTMKLNPQLQQRSFLAAHDCSCPFQRPGRTFPGDSHMIRIEEAM